MWGDKLISAFELTSNSVPTNYRLLLILAFFTAVIAIYSIFVYYFYKYLAKKNIIELNLNKYNTSEHPTLSKLIATVFYIIEYLIILPITTFFWFAILSILMLVLSKTESVATILTIAAALVAAVRVTSYISENLSRDLAKMLPFALLAFFIVEPNFFSVSLLFERFSQIPSLFSSILYFLIFIIGLELIMRVVDLMSWLFKSSEQSNENKKVVVK